jgi:ABC-type transport system involved in multi-copper enzyme maturation permease subunit
VSAQTGIAPPSGPVSRRLVDRARFRVERLKTEPNPIWIRELKQAARLARTPIVLTVVAVLMTLLIASIGGIVSTEAAPAKTGVVLFQVFFSLAYFVVTLVGPAVAANSIASEREGRTWEAVLLTGTPPGEIARGKFLGAYTAIGMYVVMLAPVGALPFLFGGVTALEVVVAFLFLFLIALLSVAFGLAISSKMTSLRVAIVITLLLAFPMTIIAYSVGGVVLSMAAHRAWPDIADGAPIWLPSAYARVPFGLEYVVFLFALPLAAVVLPAWFLYEVTIANLTSPTDDRSSGLKRWFAVAVPVLTASAAVPVLAVTPSDRIEAVVGAMCGMLVFLSFAVFLFAGDPIGPSRRVVAHWDRRGAGPLRRFFGPGVMPSAWLLLVFGVVSLAALAALGLVVLDDPTITNVERKQQQLVCFAAYCVTFYVFLVGLAAMLRARTSTPVVARVLLFTALFAVSVGPWIVAAVAGIIADSRGGADSALAIGAPSPFYVFLMIAKIDDPDGEAILIAGVAAMLAWMTIGMGLLGGARARCAKVLAEQAAALAQTEAMLRQEDEAAAREAREREISQGGGETGRSETREEERI